MAWWFFSSPIKGRGSAGLSCRICWREAEIVKLYTASAIARVLGMSEKEIAALTKSGVIRNGRTDRGLYRLEETSREIIANYRKPEEERQNVDYTSERARFMRAKRLNEEYSLKLRKGELHKSEDIELVLSKTLASFKSRLSAIPARAASQAAKMTDNAEVFNMLRDLTNEALTELSDFENLFEGGARDE